MRLNGAMIDPSITEAPIQRIRSGLRWKYFCFMDVMDIFTGTMELEPFGMMGGAVFERPLGALLEHGNSLEGNVRVRREKATTSFDT